MDGGVAVKAYLNIVMINNKQWNKEIINGWWCSCKGIVKYSYDK